MGGCDWQGPRGLDGQSRVQPGAGSACMAGSCDVRFRGSSYSHKLFRFFRADSEQTVVASPRPPELLSTITSCVYAVKAPKKEASEHDLRFF